MIGLWTLMMLAHAEPDKANSAEVRRVGEEMVAHASAGRRQALLREYRNLLALTSEVSPELHLLAADAALAEGQVAEAVARYQRVSSGAEQAEPVRELLEGIAARYGTVRLSGAPGVELTAAVRFHPEEQAAVATAREVLEQTGVFVGLLPAGEYGLGGEAFEVVAGGFASASAPASPPAASEGEADQDAAEPEGADASDG